MSLPFLPNADFGAPDGGGWLLANVRGDQAEATCNECGAVVRTVALADLRRKLDEMELSLVMCSAMCLHCGRGNIFPGFSGMQAYICQECGQAVETGES